MLYFFAINARIYYNFDFFLTAVIICNILYLYKQYSILQKDGDNLEIIVSNKTSRPLYEQIVTQMKTQIMSGELKAGEALPSFALLRNHCRLVC